MKPLPMGDFARLVRGGTLDRSQVERITEIMANYARYGMRRVNKAGGAAAAKLWLDERLGEYLGGPGDATARRYYDCFDTYVDWDAGKATVGSAQDEVQFMPEGAIRGRADVIFDRGDGRLDARIIFSDELEMSRPAAEIIALPSLLAVEVKHGQGTVLSVEVWQVGTRQRERVDADTARARDGDVRAILRNQGN